MHAPVSGSTPSTQPSSDNPAALDQPQVEKP